MTLIATPKDLTSGFARVRKSPSSYSLIMQTDSQLLAVQPSRRWQTKAAVWRRTATRPSPRRCRDTQRARKVSEERTGSADSERVTTPQAIVNGALIDDGLGNVWSRQAMVVANRYAKYLPVARR
jgi:hypothetical protein